MNQREIALFVLLAGCGNAPQPKVDYVALGAANSRPAVCAARPTAVSGSNVSALAAARADRLLAVLPDERQVIMLNENLESIWKLEFDRAGPRGVAVPVSAAIIDSVVHVVDQGKPAVRRFTMDGTPLSDIELKFLPSAVARFDNRLLVMPAVMGRYPPALAFLVRRDSVQALNIVPAEFANVSVKMIGNFLLAAPHGGKALLIHQFLTPRAYELRPDASLKELRVPLSAGVRAAVGYVPPLPLDSTALYPALVVATSAAADPRSGGYVLLTRSGRKRGGSFEKVLFKTDSLLRFDYALTLSMNAGHLAILETTSTAVLVDEEGVWHTCSL